MKPAIRIENLSKSYRLGSRPTSSYRTLRETISDSVTGAWHGLRRRFGGAYEGGSTGAEKDNTFWALKDVSFEVQPGEVVGIIGRNGAGKSTLLKILSRIVEPTAGRCEVRGRMASLLEVGTGFHPELTGRENIYLNGGILGMSRKEIDKKFDEIVDFSEIKRFLDTPVKRYSSGMYVRLAFAVAAYLEPEILVIDEVLAVGDVEFQKKCLAKMKDTTRLGKTVLFVSHNMGAIDALCNTGIYLQNGKIQKKGDMRSVVDSYLRNDREKEACKDLSGQSSVFRRIRLKDEDGRTTSTFRLGETLHVLLDLEVPDLARSPIIGINIQNQLGVRVFTVSNIFSNNILPDITGRATVSCKIPSMPLVAGEYTMRLGFDDRIRTERIDDVVRFEVVSRALYGTTNVPSSIHGVVTVESDWKIVRDEKDTGSDN